MTSVSWLWREEWGEGGQGTLQPVLVSCPMATEAPTAEMDMEETANEAEAEAVSLVQVEGEIGAIPAQGDPCTPAYNILQLATTRATGSSGKQQFGEIERMTS